MIWYATVLRKYFDFEGRARRTELWMFVLISFVISSLLSILTLGLGFLERDVILKLYSIAVFIPCLAVTVRRLHDTGKSGFYLFYNLLPVVGQIIILIFLCTEGTPHKNKYGDDPKQHEFERHAV